MTTSSMSRLALAGSLALALCGPGASVAADIDLYAAGGTADSAPNLLFFLDNSSNWSASSQAWSKADVLTNCTTIYGSGTNAQKQCAAYTETVFGSSTSLVQGQVELRALKLVLNELVCSTNGSGNIKVNIGIMLFNPAGTADSNGGVSGYIRHAVAAMDATKCKVLTDDLDNIDAKITTPDFKGPSSAEYGASLYEAFKYFGGFTNPAGVKVSGDNVAGTPTDETHFGPKRYGLKTNLEDPDAFADSSRTTYKSPIAATNSCGKNFIVLIGNTWPNQEYGTDTGAPKYPTNLLMQRLSYDPGSQIYPVPLPNSAKTNVRFADEWAKFLYTTDVSEAPGQQNVLMYTVDVYNKSADAQQGALLKSMADTNGPGGYFKVGGDIKALVDAIKNILSRITAVNSVFASASLPVSVNAQGTFLNQIFMGVFRPDDKSQQRWYGNLKQYQLALSGSTLMLVDAGGKSAVDSNSTGFIDGCASSFWTGDSSNYWESVTSQPSACLTTPYSTYSDAPDGPLVERGAAAQKLRAADPTKRNIRTCARADCSGSLVDFNTTTMSTLNATLVDWVRGRNNGDGFTDATGTTYSTYGKDTAGMRPSAHGEVVHSRPVAVNYGVSGAENVVVFYGAGDGMLRAVDGNQTGSSAGNELWAFIAPEHWSALDRVRTNSPLIAYPSTPAFTPAPQPKTYFFDGAIGGYQERTATSVSKLWIYPTMRRGGRSVYAFDVTNRPGASSQPTLMWR
ncbi:MAG TPA: hypothetical protein VFU71_09650, partial [Burkholderiaceae bacterium]|nr:hypothetical protein [Burkholderiaceae bacterium]